MEPSPQVTQYFGPLHPAVLLGVCVALGVAILCLLLLSRAGTSRPRWRTALVAGVAATLLSPLIAGRVAAAVLHALYPGNHIDLFLAAPVLLATLPISAAALITTAVRSHRRFRPASA